MTVKELRDKLDTYIKKDPPDLWQLNDCELDELYYKERCEERANRQVVLVDDGMQPEYFRIEDSFGTTIYKNTYKDEKIFAITFDKLIGEIR
jgi:hypothetical protein